MKQAIICLLLLVNIGTLAGQPIEARFKVTNCSLNGQNFDHLALANDISLAFYICDNGTQCFANHWRNTNSQSYGGVYSLKEKHFPETETTYKAIELKFTWRFFNTYDSVNGYAAVTITNIIIGTTNKIIAEIINLKTNDVLELRGYME